MKKETTTPKKGILYVVGTPIGNREDLSPRAVRVFQEVDLILCEDTRVSKKLLQHFAITTPTESYHAHTKEGKEDRYIALLEEGRALALISDSGTPTISDPGVHLITRVYETLGNEFPVVAIPGASALISALSISGIPASEFLFLGFLPHKKGRETLFKEIAESKRTVVFYESPHRIVKTLESLNEYLDTTRTLAVARELTKIFEEVQRGSAGRVLSYYKENPTKVKGEFVVVIEGK